ncbi:Peptide deformylase [Cystobacter fuscus DSM 2262]|uniref:Peptide deformylase n=1 Tax=Cystobacter fuscus (strain ATCC 25194 / DSM 2262 / NBRC 100088 / M29) TaxID=1242864 RepID=S9QUF7_CYSF2|nr:peptide deformylase [Cystobacter fuscus]EPX60278.1 Peptide deformylase [Cystobacter fuscus DSM 2262]
MVLKIVQAGEPVLRQRARDLTPEEMTSPATRQLISLMRDTMRDAPGVGLAAPQVGVDVRLVVIEDRAEYMAGLPAAELAAREREPVDFHVLINPRLTVEDATPAEFQEGCLSVSGFLALVRRARGVRVEAFDEQGQPFSRSARGWYARILQHEVDHLDGTLYIDRMEPRSFSTLDNHRRHWASRQVADIRQALGLTP